MHLAATLGAVSLHVIEYDYEDDFFEVTCPSTGEDYLVQFMFTGHSDVTIAGKTVQLVPGTAMVINPGAAFRQKFLSRNRHAVVKIARPALERVYGEWVGHPPRKKIDFAVDAVRSDTTTGAFTRQTMALLQEVHERDSIYNCRKIAASAADLLMQLLLRSAPHGESERVAASPHTISPGHLRRVERYIEEHFDTPIQMSDLAAAAGCSISTVHHAFRRYKNATPMEYLRQVRLRRARSALLSAAEDGRSVTEVALDCGFRHLSKFAKVYAQTFGEKPSQTRTRGLAMP